MVLQRRAVEAEVSSPTARRWRNTPRSMSHDHLSSATSSGRRRSLDVNGTVWPLSASSSGGDASPKREREREPSAESAAERISDSCASIHNGSSSPSLRPHTHPSSAVFEVIFTCDLCF